MLKKKKKLCKLDVVNKDKFNLVPQMSDIRMKNVMKIKCINLLLIDLFLLAR